MWNWLKKLGKELYKPLDNEKGIAPLIPLIIGGAMAAGGTIGALTNKSKASGILEKGLKEYEGINVPTQEEMMYQIDQLVQQGIITPDEAREIQADPSAYEKIISDPRFKQAQLDALTQLQTIGKEGGITPEERANLAQIQDELGTALRGEREATIQSAQERGVAGSGLELASRLGAGQAATQAASRAAVDTAAQARARALEAIQGAGSMAGQMGTQEFNQAAQKAAAIDAINKFNATNKQQTEMTNVAARNRAKEMNLTEKQRIADANKAMENEKRKYEAQLPQTEYENKMTKAAGISGEYGKLAEAEEAKRERLDRIFGTLIGAGGTVMSSGMKK
jgi:hypothetical protein